MIHHICSFTAVNASSKYAGNFRKIEVREMLPLTGTDVSLPTAEEHVHLFTLFSNISFPSVDDLAGGKTTNLRFLLRASCAFGAPSATEDENDKTPLRPGAERSTKKGVQSLLLDLNHVLTGGRVLLMKSMHGLF